MIGPAVALTGDLSIKPSMIVGVESGEPFEQPSESEVVV